MDGQIHQVEKRVIRIADYDPSWPARFAEIGAALRQALGDVALRIDHIGSTSVPGLAAKAIIDVQISVIGLEPVDPFRDRLRDLGLVYRADNPERTKRYFREAPGQPRTAPRRGPPRRSAQAAGERAPGPRAPERSDR